MYLNIHQVCNKIDTIHVSGLYPSGAAVSWAGSTCWFMEPNLRPLVCISPPKNKSEKESSIKIQGCFENMSETQFPIGWPWSSVSIPWWRESSKGEGGNLADLITRDLSCSGECAKRSPGQWATDPPTNLCQPRLSHQPSLTPALGGDDDIRIWGFESGRRFLGTVVITNGALATNP